MEFFKVLVHIYTVCNQEHDRSVFIGIVISILNKVNDIVDIFVLVLVSYAVIFLQLCLQLELLFLVVFQ
jgi:hypothetical protein